LNGSLKMQRQALAAFDEIGDRRGSSATLNNLGNLAVEMGNLDEAQKTLNTLSPLLATSTTVAANPIPFLDSETFFWLALISWREEAISKRVVHLRRNQR